MKFLSDILAKAGLTVDGVVTLNNTATGQTPAANDNSTKLATTAWVRGFVTPYSLPIASGVTLGGIKIGSGLNIDGTGIVSVASTGVGAIRALQQFTATAGQTVFTVSGGYTPGLIDVFINGVLLTPTAITSSNGNTFTLTDAAIVNDLLDVFVYNPIYNGFISTTDQVPEGSTNLYYTNARARASISLTTTGSSGAATYNSATGVLNIPSYIGGVVSIFGRTGTVIAVSGDYTTTLVTEGTNLYYTDARARAAISVTGSGSYNSATGVITVTGGVTSVNTLTGAVVLTTTNIAEGTNLYYTDARVLAYLTANSYATQTYVGTQIANLVASAPATLDTLNELAAALGNDPSFATTVATSIGTKVPQTRTITINGTGYDLSADRSWTIASGVTSFNTRTGAITPTSGDYTTALVTESGNLYYTDARARAAISLTTTGTSGAATYTSGVLNIPNYTTDLSALAVQDGTILYSPTRAFTPTGTISTSGTTVTTVGNHFSSAVVGMKLTISGETRIITVYTSATQVTVASAYSQNYSAVAIGSWGVYYKTFEVKSDGYPYFYLGNQSGGAPPGTIFLYNSGGFPTTQYGFQTSNALLNSSGLSYPKDSTIKWTNTTSYDEWTNTTNDLGIRRNSAGVLEIYNGTTLDGTVTNRRDLLVRNITASTVIVNGSVTAASAIARGTYLTPTLTAAANSDVLVGLDIAPTFTNGAFTGVTNASIRANGAVYVNNGNILVNISGSGATSEYIEFNNGRARFGFDVTTSGALLSSAATRNITFGVGTTSMGRFSANTGNFTLQNGGTFTDAGYRLDVVGTTRISGVLTLSSTISNGTYTYTLPGATGTLALTSALSSYVPTSRTLTINGDAYDLTADRTWTIGVTPSARAIQTYTATAAQTTFTVTGGYVVGLVDVFINGVRLTSADFTATNGTTVVLTTGTGVNNIVDVIKYTSAFTASSALRQVSYFTATAGQTSFTVSYTPGLIDVFYNGSKLAASEYTASNGTTVVLANAAVVNDALEIISYAYSVGAFSGQTQLNGTGLVRMSGTTVSYDNATYATQTYVTTAVANLVNAAPSTLDTLNELATALGNDANFATTVTTSIATKQPQLSGTGFVKISGTTISYDNSTYLTTASASSTYQTILTNPVTGTGTTNYLPKWTSGTAIGNSLLQEGTNSIGLGNTPSSWGYSALQIGNAALASATFGTTVFTWLGSNWYQDGTNDRFIVNGRAALISLVNGGFSYNYTPTAGTAGDAITFTLGFRVVNNGNFLINSNTDAGYKLDVNGTGRFTGDVTIKNTSTSANLFIDAAATGGSEAGLYFKNGGTNKWENYTANNDTALNWYSYANSTIVFKLASTGAATFSSSVNATRLVIGGSATSRILQVNTSGNDGIRILTSGDNPTLDLMQTAAANGNARNWRIVSNWEGWGTLDFQSGTNNTSDPATTRLSLNGVGGTSIFSGALSVQSTIESRAAQGNIRSYSTNAVNDAIVFAGWTSDTGIEIRYNPNSAISYIQNSYPAEVNQEFGDIHFRRKLSGTFTTTMIVKGYSSNVGIGLTNPTQKLHVNGYIRANGISVFKNEGSVAGFIGHEQDWFGTGSSNNLIFASEGGNSFKVFTNGGTAERITATSTGYVYLGKGWGASNHRINLEVAQGNNILVVSAYAGASNDSVIIRAASGANPNAALSVMEVTTNSATGRSISAGGTINASGNDYAEYMIKAVTDNISKGDIVGIDNEGLLTNIFSDAVSFVVKSTDPSYVGGDAWGNIVGKRPERTTDQTEEYFAPILAEFEAKLEVERQKVDRIAFSGQVPCNVYEASVGDYIIPIETLDGKITGQAVTNPTFEQYQISVGKVWKIMEDGRAWIAVKIG
jgi:hypothetical protein